MSSINDKTLQSNKLKLIYIMGEGRSGSTILDIVLGNHPDIGSFGELNNIPKCYINPDSPLAAEPEIQRSFWEKIKNDWKEKCGSEIVTEHFRLQMKFERFRSVHRLLYNLIFPSKDFEKYKDQLEELYKILSSNTGKTILVDSSKNPIKAYILSLMPQVDLYIIHLVRDGRGVAWSRKKSFKKNFNLGIAYDIKEKPVWKSGLIWNKKNILSEIILSKIKNSHKIRIRYEDLVSDSSGTFKKIEDFTQVNFTPLTQKIENKETLELGYIMGGNRLRKSNNFHLKPDVEWIEKLSKKEKRLYWLVSGWLLKRYGYKSINS